MAIKKYNLKSGERWMFNEYIGTDPITGKKIIVTRRGFRTKRDAEIALRRLKYEFDRGFVSSSNGVTYGEVYDMWLPLYKETVKGSTYSKTKINFEHHVLPYFGKVPINKITPTKCQTYANSLAPELVNYKAIYNSASRVYEYAYKIGLTNQANPFKRVIMPKQRKGKDKTPFLEKDELEAVLEAFRQDGNTKWHAYFRLLAYTGMRRGEALALTWPDIDCKNNTVRINKTLSIDYDGTPCITNTKTSASERTIEIDPETLSILLAYRKTYSGKIDSIYVFPGDKGGFTSLSKPRHNLVRTIKKHGLKPITVHSFRHTHCSLLFDAGWNIKDVQERLGHSDIKTTMDIYAHVTEDKKRKSMDSFVKFMQA